MSLEIFKSLSPELQEKFRAVKLFLTDVDGVLTDGTLLIGNGIELKRFSIPDGLGMRLLMQNGVQVGWISNRYSQTTAERAKELGVEILVQQPGNKIEFAEQILKQTGFEWKDVCYTGDDLVDICMFRRVPLSIAVKNAHPLLHQMADYVTHKRGGRGATREVAELILHAQGKWDGLEILQRGL